MKTSIIALAATLAVANASSGAEAKRFLDLDVGIDADVDLEIGDLIDLEVHLPIGISLGGDDEGPAYPPCKDCTDVWHPPHHGVDMDECDDDSSDGWHWVHPGPGHHPDQGPHMWTTSTITSHSTSTVIECPTEVPDCPAHSTIYTTVVIPEKTTICPAPASTSSIYYPPPPAYTTKVSMPPTMIYSSVPLTTYAPPESTYVAPPPSSYAPPESTYVAPPPSSYAPVPPPVTTIAPPVTTYVAPTTMVPEYTPPAMTSSNFTYPNPSNWTAPPPFTAGAPQINNAGLAAFLGLFAAIFV